MKTTFYYLGISMALSFISAVTYVIFFTINLPVTDGAHGMAPFEDPLVFPIMSIIALITGFVGWPCFALLGRRSRLDQVAISTGIASIMAIVCITPFNLALGFYAAVISVLFVLVFFWRRDRKRSKKTEPIGVAQ